MPEGDRVNRIALLAAANACMFVFGVVLRSRFSEQDSSTSGFALYFLAGMLPWLAFSEAAGRAPGVMLEHRNFVQKLVFAVETTGNYVVVYSTDLGLPGPNTVDLFLTLDPPTRRIIAQYRVNRNDSAGVVTLGEINAIAYPGIRPFFKLGTAAVDPVDLVAIPRRVCIADTCTPGSWICCPAPAPQA